MRVTGHKTRSDRYRIVDEQDIAAALAKTAARTNAEPARPVIPLRQAAEARPS
jgi:hypothetical protein